MRCQQEEFPLTVQTWLLPRYDDPDVPREERLALLIEAVSTAPGVEALTRFLDEDLSILTALGHRGAVLVARHAPARFLLSEPIAASISRSPDVQRAIIARDDAPSFIRTMAIDGLLGELCEGAGGSGWKPRTVENDEALRLIAERDDLSSGTSTGRGLLGLATGEYSSLRPRLLRVRKHPVLQLWASDLLLRNRYTKDADLAEIVYGFENDAVHATIASHPNAGRAALRAIAYQAGPEALAVIVRQPASFNLHEVREVLLERLEDPFHLSKSVRELVSVLEAAILDPAAETRRECLLLLLDTGIASHWESLGEDSPRGASYRSLLGPEDLARFVSSKNAQVRTQAILAAPLFATQSVQPVQPLAAPNRISPSRIGIK